MCDLPTHPEGQVYYNLSISRWVTAEIYDLVDFQE